MERCPTEIDLVETCFLEDSRPNRRVLMDVPVDGPSNRRLRPELGREALALVRSQYEDFGPTLAHEKLTELHGLEFSVEAHRHWMIEARSRTRPAASMNVAGITGEGLFRQCLA